MDGEGEDAALASVRAFLDACDASALGFDEGGGEQVAYAISSGSDGDLGAVQAPALRSKRARPPNRRGYSTELQRRKRAELDTLREYACELETRLAKFQGAAAANFRPSDSTSGVKSVALARLEAAAATELRLRRRSEAANRQLQAELKRCHDLRASIVRLIDKYRPQSSMDELRARSLSPPCDTVSAPNPFASQVVIAPGDIERQLEAMLRQTDGVFATSPSRSGAACWLETNRRSDGVEIRSSTASACSVAAAESLLWLTPGLSSGNEVWCSNMVSADGNSYAKVFVMPLSCRPWATPSDQQVSSASATVDMPVKVHHFARKVRDDATGRLVIAMFTVLGLPPVASRGGSLLVHEQSWTLVTPTAPGNGSAGSTVQTCYRLGGSDEPAGEQGDRLNDEARAMRTSVMRALVHMTRRHRSMMQNWLLEAADEW